MSEKLSPARKAAIKELLFEAVVLVRSTAEYKDDKLGWVDAFKSPVTAEVFRILLEGYDEP